MTMTSPARDLAQQVRDRYLKDTDGHVLTVLHDDGLYRHLRFCNPFSSEYWFDVISAPGILTVHGDMGTYTLARERDMFAWVGFRGIDGGISYDYWAQKLVAPQGRASVQEFSQRVFADWIGNFTQDHLDQMGENLHTEFATAVLHHFTPLPENVEEAHERMRDFEFHGIEIADEWEYSFREYTLRWLWNCWGIADVIRRYSHATGRDSE